MPRHGAIAEPNRGGKEAVCLGCCSAWPDANVIRGGTCATLRLPSDYEERLRSSRAGANSNVLVNRLAHHLQYLIRNISHTVYCRDVIGEFGQNLLVGVAASLELAPGNEVVTVKDFCHSGSPNEAAHEDFG